MEDKKSKIMGDLFIMDNFKIKPNYSAMQRETGIDRHTLKKWHKEGKIPERKKAVRTSKWEPLKDEIIELMEIDYVTKKSVYKFLENKYGDEIPGSYNGFKAYTLI